MKTFEFGDSLSLAAIKEMRNYTPYFVSHIKENYVKVHKHNYIECFYVINGEADHILGQSVSHIKKGDYIFIDFDTQHSYFNGVDFEIINFNFLPYFIDASLINCRNFKQLASHYLLKLDYNYSVLDPSNHIFNDKDGKVKHLFTSALSEFKKQRRGYLEISRTYMLQLLIFTLREINSDNKTAFSPLVENIINIINKKAFSNITLQEISRELNYSVSYLSNQFKIETGILFNDYIQQKRIAEACHLIATTDMKLSEIAFSVGYASVKHFQKLFKLSEGITPQQYRKNLKQTQL